MNECKIVFSVTTTNTLTITTIYIPTPLILPPSIPPPSILSPSITPSLSIHHYQNQHHEHFHHNIIITTSTTTITTTTFAYTTNDATCKPLCTLHLKRYTLHLIYLLYITCVYVYGHVDAWLLFSALYNPKHILRRLISPLHNPPHPPINT